MCVFYPSVTDAPSFFFSTIKLNNLAGGSKWRDRGERRIFRLAFSEDRGELAVWLSPLLSPLLCVVRLYSFWRRKPVSPSLSISAPSLPWAGRAEVCRQGPWQKCRTGKKQEADWLDPTDIQYMCYCVLKCESDDILKAIDASVS